jgi:hypothetical protein
VLPYHFAEVPGEEIGNPLEYSKTAEHEIASPAALRIPAFVEVPKR